MKSEKMMMCFTKIELIANEYGKIQISPLPTPSLSADDGTELFQASGPFGSIHFHEIKNDSYNIWHSNYLFQQDTILSASSDKEFLGLHFTLKNNFNYNIDGFSEGIILELHYNMVYVPYVQCEYTFQKAEEYSTFDIQFTHAYLQHWCASLPLFSEFLNKVKHKMPALISETYQFVTPEMTIIIQDILYCPLRGTLKKIYLESKVLNLLLLSLQNIDHDSHLSKVMLQLPDIKKIQGARKYLLEHMTNPCSIEELAYLVGTNDFKLKNGFKQVYGTTVFGLLYEERMQKGRTLLMETDMQIKKIALSIGYKRLSSFTEAFKKKFGYPPSTLRRRNILK